MANVVFDYEWARRVSAEHLARTLKKRMVTKALRRKGDAAAEYLSSAHADKIDEAVRYVDWGADVLSELLSEAAGPKQTRGSFWRRGQTWSSHSVRPVGQVTGTGGLPRGNYSGQRPETVGVGHVRLNRSVATIDPRAARDLVDAMEPLRRSIIKDSTDVFREALAVRKLEGLPKNSAAFATVHDLIEVCVKGAREIIDRRVADVASGIRRKA